MYIEILKKLSGGVARLVELGSPAFRGEQACPALKGGLGLPLPIGQDLAWPDPRAGLDLACLQDWIRLACPQDWIKLGLPTGLD